MWLWTGGDRECGVWVIAGRSNAFAGECSTAISPSGIAAALAQIPTNTIHVPFRLKGSSEKAGAVAGELGFSIFNQKARALGVGIARYSASNLP